MPPVVAAIAVYFTVSTAMATLILVAGVSMAVSIGFAAYTMANMPNMPGYSAEVNGRTQVIRSAVTPHRVIYGKCLVSGPLVFIASAGDKNKYLYLVVVLASHECEEIGDIYLGDTLLTDPKFNTPTRTAITPKTVTDGVVTMMHDVVSGFAMTYVTLDGEGSPADTPVPSDAYVRSGRIVTFLDTATWDGVVVSVAYDTTYAWATVTKYLGTQIQAADPDLIADAVDDAGNHIWTSAHTLTGRCYIVVRLEYNVDIFSQGIPNIKAVVKRVNNIYDPRTETTGYTDNAVLCVRDFLVKKHGLGCGSSDINDTFFNYGANICDEIVPVKVGTGAGYTTDGSLYDVGRTLLKLITGVGTILAGDSITITVVAGTYDGVAYLDSITTYVTEDSLSSTSLITLSGTGLSVAVPPVACAVSVVPTNSEKRYACNGSFTLDGKPTDIIKKILTACAGRIVWSQGQYSIFPAAYIYPTFTLSEDDLRGDISITPSPSKRQRFNTVRGTFVSPSQYWQQVDFPFVQDDVQYALDENEELAQTLELPYTLSSATSQRLASIFLQKNLHSCTVEFPAKLTAFPIQPGDTGYLNISQLGLINIEFTVIGWKLSDDGGVDLTLREESTSVYGWTSAKEVALVPAAKPFIVSASVVTAPASLTATESAVSVPAGSVTRSDVTLAWTNIDAMATSFVVQKNGIDYSTTTTNSFIFTNLPVGSYNFAVSGVNASGVRSSATTITHNVTTPSLTLPTMVLSDEGTPGQPSKRLALLNGELVTVEV